MSEEAKIYPRRIQDLQDTVKRIKNGGDGVPTASQSRELTLQLADIIPDLWDSIRSNRIHIESIINQKKTPKAWFVENVLPSLVTWAILGTIAWFIAVNQHITIIGG